MATPKSKTEHSGSLVAENVLPDQFLVRSAERYIREHYKKGRHHVACVLQCDERQYWGLHIDSPGYDVCAESVAIANALMAGEKTFHKLVAVRWNGDALSRPEIVAPCGDCRQLLVQYAPELTVIIESSNETSSVRASDLLPWPYEGR
jgi:cytidine deaminase